MSRFTLLYQPEPDNHNLPDCRIVNTVARCHACGGVFVVRTLGFPFSHEYPRWVRLRWWHRTARKGVRAAALAVAQENVRGGYPAGGVVDTNRPMTTNFPSHPTLPGVPND